MYWIDQARPQASALVSQLSDWLCCEGRQCSEKLAEGANAGNKIGGKWIVATTGTKFSLVRERRKIAAERFLVYLMPNADPRQ